MRILEVKPKSDYMLQIITDDGRTGFFDVSPYLKFEAFNDLKNQDKGGHQKFLNVHPL